MNFSTTDFYYESVEKKIPNAIYATKYSKSFGINKIGQDNIYTNKIKLIQGKRIADFN